MNSGGRRAAHHHAGRGAPVRASGGGEPVCRDEVEPGQRHRADHGLGVDGQGDVHRPVGPALAELAGAVQRVDDPDPSGVVVDGLGPGGLLGADPVTGEAAPEGRRRGAGATTGRLRHRPPCPLRTGSAVRRGRDRPRSASAAATSFSSASIPPLLHDRGSRRPGGYAARAVSRTTCHVGRAAPAVPHRLLPGAACPLRRGAHRRPRRCGCGSRSASSQSRPGGTVSGTVAHGPGRLRRLAGRSSARSARWPWPSPPAFTSTSSASRRWWT